MTRERDEHHLVTVFLASGHGTTAESETALRHAYEAGVCAADIEETLLLLVPFAGVPRALLAFGHWRRLVPSVQSPVIGRPDSTGRRGADTFASVYGPASTAVTQILEGLHPDLCQAAIEDAYGRMLARESFSFAHKEILATAFLIRLEALPQAKAHGRAAVRHGASTQSIRLAFELGSASLGEAAKKSAEVAIASVLHTRSVP